MPITEVTEAQIEAMKNRLAQKRYDRIIERDIDEVVKMVQKHPLPNAPEKAAEKNDGENVFNAIAIEMIAIFGAIYWNEAISVYGLIAFFIISIMAFFEFKNGGKNK